MSPPIGRRGHNLFKHKDGLRAIKIARDGGMNPGMLEIAVQDGTVFRIYDLETAAAKQAPQNTNPWDEVLTNVADKKRPA